MWDKHPSARVVMLALQLPALILLLRPIPMNPATFADREIIAPAKVAAILDRACRDCHSDHTRWPWYSRLPGLASMVQLDVRRGRKYLNFSEWQIRIEQGPEETSNELAEVCIQVTHGDMPPFRYMALHPGSALTSMDIRTLCAWSAASSPAISP